MYYKICWDDTVQWTSGCRMHSDLSDSWHRKNYEYLVHVSDQPSRSFYSFIHSYIYSTHHHFQGGRERNLNQSQQSQAKEMGGTCSGSLPLKGKGTESFFFKSVTFKHRRAISVCIKVTYYDLFKIIPRHWSVVKHQSRKTSLLSPVIYSWHFPRTNPRVEACEEEREKY